MENKSKFAILQVPSEELDRIVSSLGKKKTPRSDLTGCIELTNNWIGGTGCQCNTDGTYSCSDWEAIE